MKPVHNFRGKPKMMNPKDPRPPDQRWLEMEEVRLVSDLRIMHSKVHDLYTIVSHLRQRFSEEEIDRYADQEMLSQEIQQVDEIYLWFVKLKEEQRQKRA